MTVLLGTSGWQYRDWRDVLYPPGCPQRLWLEEYARNFATVENNNAFYRLPTEDNFADWRDRTPEGFVMAVKASRFLTHIKRLRDPEEPVHRLMSRAAALGSRLGPVLLQLPPTLRADAGALDACLSCFPPTTRVAVEPRHDSWWTARVRGVLEKRGAALCWADRGSRPVTPLWRTAGWGYVRFHEGRAVPWPRYGRRALATWARRIADAWPGTADVYVYFNNDPGGAAVLDAIAFARAAAAAAGLTVSRVPTARGVARGPGAATHLIAREMVRREAGARHEAERSELPGAGGVPGRKEADMTRKRVVVSGDVQGVFFRDSCRRTALEHGVAGWVRNLPDGTVEAVFEGDPGPVERLVAWVRQGPRAAFVTGVSVHEEEPEGLTGFGVLPTPGRFS